jgi:subtilase family serine protease
MLESGYGPRGPPLGDADRQEIHVARRLLLAAASAIALVAAGLGTVTANAAAAPSATPKITTQRACGNSAKGHARCLALVRTDAAAAAPTAKMASAAKGGVNPNVAPSGLGPADIQSAYKLTGPATGVKTVAIVDAYDDPTAEQDLGVYRSQFGLNACTTANGCFKKVNQSGGSSLPRVDGGWAQEISLDLDMVSATCPNCKILLVEATTPSFSNLGKAVDQAARMGAAAISNSYGGSDASDSTYGAPYNKPGIAVTVSSGDSGYGAEYPASSKFVTAVGGTSLKKASNARGWTETAWSGAGSGCSNYNAALGAAADAGTGCSRRAVADVSAVADPSTGVAVYDSTAYQGRSGWLVFGGTSASSPIIASVYALAGRTGGNNYLNTLPYAHPSSLNDVTSGKNGTCPTSQWCNARVGWDGPTGLGTPNGTGAF